MISIFILRDKKRINLEIGKCSLKYYLNLAFTAIDMSILGMEILTVKNVKSLYPKLPNLGFKKAKPVNSKVPMHYELGV